MMQGWERVEIVADVTLGIAFVAAPAPAAAAVAADTTVSMTMDTAPLRLACWKEVRWCAPARKVRA